MATSRREMKTRSEMRVEWEERHRVNVALVARLRGELAELNNALEARLADIQWVVSEKGLPNEFARNAAWHKLRYEDKEFTTIQNQIIEREERVYKAQAEVFMTMERLKVGDFYE